MTKLEQGLTSIALFGEVLLKVYAVLFTLVLAYYVIRFTFLYLTIKRNDHKGKIAADI